MKKKFSQNPYYPYVIGAFSAVFMMLSLVFMLESQGIRLGSHIIILGSTLILASLAGIAVAVMLQKNQSLEESHAALQKFAHKLTSENEKLSETLSDAVDGSYKRDTDGSFIDIDEAFAKTLGFDDRDSALKALKIMGGNFYKAPSALPDYLFEMQKHGSVVNFESEVRGYGKDTRWIVESAKTVEKQGKKYFRGIVKDTTKYHGSRDNAGLGSSSSRHAHSQKAEALGVLAEGIADEMHIPAKDAKDNVLFLKEVFDGFSKIILSAKKLIDVLARAPNPPREIKETLAAMEEYKLDYILKEAPRAIASAEKEMDEVCALAKSVKAYSQTENLDKNMVDLNETIMNAITVSRNRWQSYMDLKTDFNKELPLVPCLASELSEVILNLIMNGAEAIKEDRNDGLGSIIIRTSYDDEWATIKIIDNGGGIPDDVLKNIFVPFFSTKGKGKGFGQGLAYCQGVISQKHGGILDVASKIGKGSTFTIKLPLAPSDIEGESNAQRAAG